MATKIQRFFSKGLVKLSLAVATILAITITALHLWFVHNSNRLLIDLVNKRSDGKLKLELSRVNFNFFSNEVKIHEAKITSTDKEKTRITYQVSFQKITLSTNSLLSAFFKNALEIRKIKLYDPVIEVFGRPKDSIADSKNNLSLGIELGKLYHSVEDAIIALNTHSISIINAKLILNNRESQGKKPLIFSNIYFSLTKLNKNTVTPGKYITNNNISFNSSNQDISFTDGIHKLLFKRLVIQKARNIILDSCTIIALPTLESHSSFNIHFKKLALIGVDFDTLYKTNLIKADSVYCEDPIIDLNLNGNVTGSNNGNKGMPDPNKILQEFAGDLDLGFLGVMNGDIHLNITGKKKQSNIHSGKVNFRIKKLRISPDSSRLISMNTFDMLIKGYHLYNKDSSCIYSFDSIRFANDRLVLNNFSAHTTSGANKIRNYRNFTVPYFELVGVDWPELIFDQNLKADEAILRDPTINYRKTPNVEISKKSLMLTSRHNLDDFMEIDRLSVINGNLNIKWDEDKSLQLEGFNLSILGDNLSDYKHVRLQKDIESLMFKNGILRAGDITARLNDITFKTNDEVHAGQLVINNDQGGIDSKLNDVSLKNIYSGQTKGTIVIDALQWTDGNITISPILHQSAHVRKTSVLLKNISGGNTQFNFNRDGIACSAFVTKIQAASLQKSNDSPIAIEGLKLNGSKINFSNASIQMNSENYILSDNFQEFSKTHFEKAGNKGKLLLDISSLRLTDNINSFFANELNFKNILLISAVISFRKQTNLLTAIHEKPQARPVKIASVTMHEPVVNLQFGEDLFQKTISLQYSKGSEIKADNIQILKGETTVNALHINAQKAEIKGTEKNLSVDNGIDLNVTKISVSSKGDSTTWRAMLNRLNIKNKDGYEFNIKDNKLFLKDLTIENCQLSSNSITNIRQLLSSNENISLTTSKAKYVTKKSTWQFANVSFKGGRNLLELDSINFQPLMSRDSFIASSPYQTDYLKFTSGNTKLYGFNLAKYLNENALSIEKANFIRPELSVYRDKLPPFLEGIRKELFTEKIKKISFPVSINQISINDGKVTYTERNDGNRLEGNLLLAHLNGNISDIKNNGNRRTDSLSLTLTGRMLDKAFFDFKLKQSYIDPLLGFTMNLSLEPALLNFLNPLLAPLSNIRFTTGGIDKFEMSAAGNENSAQGEMKFYYHNLHIQLLKNGGVQRTAFIKKRESDLVNFFFLKNNNTSRTGLVYFKRLKDRSFFNYINKIIFSGLITSTGARNNNRYRKEMIKNDQLKSKKP